MVLQMPSLLITDDDRDFRETLQSVFEPRGFRTLLAGDGEEAVKIVKRQPVHLALLDMHMPRLTGLEAIRRVKQMHAALPCILLSAGLDDALAEQAREAEAFSVHRKPISFLELTDIVSLAMRQTYDWPDDALQ
jgi:CheY-like chemotaxis protein